MSYLKFVTNQPKKKAEMDQRNLAKEGVGSTLKKVRFGWELITISDRVLYTTEP